jgi:diphosphomevalonate decarboxylase
VSQLLVPYKSVSNLEFESTWASPANIAFVKYWGKKGHQIPANPSLSMSLSECRTTTKTKITPSDKLSVQLKFDGKSDLAFAAKIEKYILSLQEELPCLKSLSFDIQTENTFPHGAGIASSASGMSAFALTLANYLNHLKPESDQNLFLKRASYLSRLASGSACRSIYGGFSHWGKSDIEGSTDKHAVPISVHDSMAQLQDTILVIDSSEKNVPSTMGHGLMSDHHFAQSRFAQARNHFTACVSALKSGDIDSLGSILESEALSLHAMMLTSPKPYILMKGNTLLAIEAIWAFRRETQLPIFFTLDAGPNLHLIYPESYKKKITPFINEVLSPFSERIIFDELGKGPHKC